jgi:hypothetical protein
MRNSVEFSPCLHSLMQPRNQFLIAVHAASSKCENEPHRRRQTSASASTAAITCRNPPELPSDGHFRTEVALIFLYPWGTPEKRKGISRALSRMSLVRESRESRFTHE